MSKGQSFGELFAVMAIIGGGIIAFFVLDAILKWNLALAVASIGTLIIVLFILSGAAILTGMMVFPHYPKLGRIISYLGIAGFLIFLTFAEITLVGSSLTLKTLGEYQRCSEATSLPSGLNDIIPQLSCILSGYEPTGDNFWSTLFLITFSIVVPIYLLYAIFTEFVDASGVIQDVTRKRLIGLCFGLLAYKGFVVSRLIYLLDFGSAGIAMLAINFIWTGGLLGFVNRVYATYRSVEDANKIADKSIIIKNRLVRSLETLSKSALGGSEIDAIVEASKPDLSESVGLQTADAWTKSIIATADPQAKKNIIRQLVSELRRL